MMQHHWKIVERANPNALHALCDSRERAQFWIDTYGDSGIFTDKTLTRDSFEIVPPPGFRHIADVLAGLEEVRTALGAARRHPDAVRLDGVE